MLVTVPPRWPSVVIVLFIWTLTTHGKFTVSGDEPHYLIISESLLADGDLDVDNNYRQNDGRRFGADGLTPGLHARQTPDGRLWPVHDVGLPVLLVPIYGLATRVAELAPPSVLARFRQTPGLFAFSLISLMFTLLTVWAAWLLLSALWRVAPRHAAIVVLALVLSPPVLSHAFLVFPETAAFAVTCSVVWLICLRDEELTVARVAMVAAAIGLLPWIHRKFSLFVVGLVVLILARRRQWITRQTHKALITIGALVVLPQIALHLWTMWEWGNVGGPQMLDWVPFSFSGLQTGGVGMITDRERGLLAYAPVYLLAPACWAVDWRRSRAMLVPILALLLPLAAFVTWTGGFSPAARFIMPVTPLLLLPAAWALNVPLVRWSAMPIGIFQLVITLLAWWHPRDLWPKELGTNQLLEKISVIGPLYERCLPSIATGDSPIRGWIVIGVVLVFTSVIAVFARRSTPRVGRLPGLGAHAD
jgi:hypothetical protein